MDTDSNPIKVSNDVETEDKNKKRGLEVMGYMIPWWAIALVLIVILYLAYANGYIADMLGDARMQPGVIKEISLKGPVIALESETVPAPVKKLFAGKVW